MDCIISDGLHYQRWIALSAMDCIISDGLHYHQYMSISGLIIDLTTTYHHALCLMAKYEHIIKMSNN